VCLIATVGQRSPSYGGRKACRIKKGEDILTLTERVCLKMQSIMDRYVSGESRLMGYDTMVVGTEELAPSLFGLVYFVVFCVTVHIALYPTSKTSLQRCENFAYHLKSFSP
jgi:hypothetical protein